MKILALCIALLLTVSGLGVVALPPVFDADELSVVVGAENIVVSDFSIKSVDNQYVKVSLSEGDELLLNPGCPVLPVMTEVFELPFGASNIDVEVRSFGVESVSLESDVLPAPSPMPLGGEFEYAVSAQKDMSVYASSEPYPSKNFAFNVGVGLNDGFEHVTFVSVHVYPVQYKPGCDELLVAESVDISISYAEPKTDVVFANDFDLVVIAPEKFSDEIQPLIVHKTNVGVPAFFKSVEQIYDEFSGVDEAEQIKYFIKDSIEESGVKYVLLVGGLKSTLFARPRDNANIGASGWHVPVRYSNLRCNGDPGYPTDLYYADIYAEGGVFDDWDSDGDGIFAEWAEFNGPPDDDADLVPDVAVGRLASSDEKEVSEMVDKIIRYETTTSGLEDFEKMIVISGDGFLDQFDLDIQWDTSSVDDGQYTICAQSFNPESDEGPVDRVEVTVDKTLPSVVVFNHDDNLNPALEAGYPAPPIAEIVSVSAGDILGNTDVEYDPGEGLAYCNSLFWWANVSYVDEVLTIRGKSYDPKPYGNLTDLHVWVEDSTGTEVFSEWVYDNPTYYEGEWATGAELVNGRGGALSRMPTSFESEILWTSNGAFTGPDDVIESFSNGAGFVFFSGHGSPGTWGDQYPGIPGNRAGSSITGLSVSNIMSIPPFISGSPLFPMTQLDNSELYPVTVVGGCHNSLFNVSMIPSALHYFSILLGRDNWMWTYISAVPQCWSWYLTQLPNAGSIATIGNTGLGWGWEGEFCTVGAGDGWVTSEFFGTYGDHYGEPDFDMLGNVYVATQTEYVNTFSEFTLPECWWSPDLGWDAIDQQAIEQWVLLGDPSLKIGGYD